MCDTDRIAKIVDDRMLVAHNEFTHIKDVLVDIKKSFEKLNCQRYNEVQINLKNKLLLFKQDIELYKGRTDKDIENIAESVRKSKDQTDKEIKIIVDSVRKSKHSNRSKVWSIALLVVSASLLAVTAFAVLYMKGDNG